MTKKFKILSISIFLAVIGLILLHYNINNTRRVQFIKATHQVYLANKMAIRNLTEVEKLRQKLENLENREVETSIYRMMATNFFKAEQRSSEMQFYISKMAEYVDRDTEEVKDLLNAAVKKRLEGIKKQMSSLGVLLGSKTSGELDILPTAKYYILEAGVDSNIKKAINILSELARKKRVVSNSMDSYSLEWLKKQHGENIKKIKEDIKRGYYYEAPDWLLNNIK